MEKWRRNRPKKSPQVDVAEVPSPNCTARSRSRYHPCCAESCHRARPSSWQSELPVKRHSSTPWSRRSGSGAHACRSRRRSGWAHRAVISDPDAGGGHQLAQRHVPPSSQTCPASTNTAPAGARRKGSGKRSSMFPSSSTSPPTGRRWNRERPGRHVTGPSLMDATLQPAPSTRDVEGSSSATSQGTALMPSTVGPSRYWSKPRTLLGPPAKNRFCGLTRMAPALLRRAARPRRPGPARPGPSRGRRPRTCCPRRSGGVGEGPSRCSGRRARCRPARCSPELGVKDRRSGRLENVSVTGASQWGSLSSARVLVGAGDEIDAEEQVALGAQPRPLGRYARVIPVFRPRVRPRETCPPVAVRTKTSGTLRRSTNTPDAQAVAGPEEPRLGELHGNEAREVLGTACSRWPGPGAAGTGPSAGCPPGPAPPAGGRCP
jgi:hypothetical protein